MLCPCWRWSTQIWRLKALHEAHAQSARPRRNVSLSRYYVLFFSIDIKSSWDNHPLSLRFEIKMSLSCNILYDAPGRGIKSTRLRLPRLMARNSSESSTSLRPWTSNAVQRWVQKPTTDRKSVFCFAGPRRPHEQKGREGQVCTV